MFKLQPKPTFWARVPITVPGQAKPEIVEMEFRYVPEEERQKLLSGRTTEDFLLDVVIGWRDVDADFSVDNLKRLFANHARSQLDVLETFNRELFGAREKNS